MSEQPELKVKEVIVPDPAIWPTDYSKRVKRWSLVDERGVVWANGRQFGLLHMVVTADRSSYDARYILRESPSEAWIDLIRWPVDRTKDMVRQCLYFDWNYVPDLIFECGGPGPVIEAFFETSGSSVIRDFHWNAWIERAVAHFGELLREPAERWAVRTEPKYMPTSYESDPNLKARHVNNIKATALEVLRRLEAVNDESR